MDKIKELENIFKELLEYIYENKTEREIYFNMLIHLKTKYNKKEYEQKLNDFMLSFLKAELKYFNSLKDYCYKDNKIRKYILNGINICDKITHRLILLNQKDNKVVN